MSSYSTRSTAKSTISSIIQRQIVPIWQASGQSKSSPYWYYHTDTAILILQKELFINKQSEPSTLRQVQQDVLPTDKQVDRFEKNSKPTTKEYIVDASSTTDEFIGWATITLACAQEWANTIRGCFNPKAQHNVDYVRKIREYCQQQYMTKDSHSRKSDQRQPRPGSAGPSPGPNKVKPQYVKGMMEYNHRYSTTHSATGSRKVWLNISLLRGQSIRHILIR